ncbi:uncharacterized protein G2W53_028362 [Senna tora]|uniref:Uncharacterized protein n=1 Tax=Senna tora TaxID=362788 RepID=A0A834T389_9FABA|nr:uncharacterized protein G2W53_028362 [Senna tora]
MAIGGGTPFLNQTPTCEWILPSQFRTARIFQPLADTIFQ